jgi:hypothetical protein
MFERAQVVDWSIYCSSNTVWGLQRNFIGSMEYCPKNLDFYCAYEVTALFKTTEGSWRSEKLEY